MFEVVHKDLMGRIGLLHTHHGAVETPLFLPVISPTRQIVKPREMKEQLKCKAVITNAYLLLKRGFSKSVSQDLHQRVDFDGVIMTDSGAYQLLEYGRVHTDAEEIARFQEDIGSDIAVVLDVPTGDVDREQAAETVKKTLANSRKTLEVVSHSRTLWVGPVQGGSHIDLLEYSARESSKMGFDIHALGSPTVLMERYLFSPLVDMICAAKMNLPIERPLHLFGAGHPMMFSLAVALGCDMFDSAAYSLYAKNDRYMTARGTIKLIDVRDFPCFCRVCSHILPKELKDLKPELRERMLALHNLHVCFEEIRRIKQAIFEGRLWELVELRARSHPSLFRGFARAVRNADYMEMSEKNTPVSKRRGIFLLDNVSLNRPEVRTYFRRLKENYSPPRGKTLLLLLPSIWRDPEAQRIKFSSRIDALVQKKSTHVCYYGPPFALVPGELVGVFPLLQSQSALDTADCLDRVVVVVLDYLNVHKNYSRVIFLWPDDESWRALAEVCASAVRKKLRGVSVSVRKASSRRFSADVRKK
ncbi:MAG: tRNA guanosine(15) transglycosylase TgtA [Nitrososphaeria archaeon]